MKNKKIISLTIFAVVLVLAGILGLSKVFENGWQNENTVDNSLSAEIVDSTETFFDYPYFNIEEHSQISDSEILARYEKEISYYEENIRNADKNVVILRFDTEPTSDMITYQDVANICGEAIKYMYGITKHSNYPAVISYYYDARIKSYTYYSYTLIMEDDYIGMKVNPLNGEIISLGTSHCLAIEPDENIKLDTNIKDKQGTIYLTEDMRQSLEKQVIENMEILGLKKYNEKIEFTDIYSDDGYYRVYVNIKHTDNSETWMGYNTVDFNYYELWDYGIRYD